MTTLVQFSHSVMSNSLRPHGLQHSRPPCPSPTPQVYLNSRPLSQWCHPTISSSVIPFSSCPQSFPRWESFQMSQLFASGGQSIGASASTSVLPMNTQDWDNEKGHLLGLPSVTFYLDIIYSVMPLLTQDIECFLALWRLLFVFAQCFFFFFYCLKLPCMKIYKCEFLQIKHRCFTQDLGPLRPSSRWLQSPGPVYKDRDKTQPFHPKGNQSCFFIGRTDAEAETPIFSPPDVKNWLIWKDLGSGNDWRQEEKGETED